MSNNRFPIRRAAYGPTFVVTFDEDKTRPSEDAAISRKLDKILDALEREVKGDRSTPQQSLEEAIAEIIKKYERDARRQGINPAPEALGIDYAAMNPHRRSSGIVCSEKPHIRKDGRLGMKIQRTASLFRRTHLKNGAQTRRQRMLPETRTR